MKPSIYVLGILYASGLWVAAQDQVDPSLVGELPERRQGSPVTPGKPSPYGLPDEKKKKQTATKRQYSEEDQIKSILSSLPVTGVIGNGKKVLLGNIILKEGELVDDVLPNQREQLLVKEITEDQVLLEWIEEFRRPNARQLPIAIDLKPRVRVLLKGHPEGTKPPMGIARPPLGAEDDDF